MKYTIDIDVFDEGGSAEFYKIKENKNLGFKQFRNKKFAISAYNRQRLLSKFGLAPKVYGKVCRLEIKIENFAGEDYTYTDHTNWGFVTEKAKILDDKIMSKRLKEIQNLVESIEKKTKLKFWDCHYWNIGYIKRNNKTKLVCIDTGTESFDSMSNAWGFDNPGPKCSCCHRYQCKCSSGYWCIP
jgi:hypothetical protein